METKNELDRFLNDLMDIRHSETVTPGTELLKASRNKVLSRKRTKKREKDIFLLIAGFLHSKIEFNYMVITLCVFSLSFIYLTHRPGNLSPEYDAPGEPCNTLSVKNSTVLPGLNTFIIN